MLSTSLESINGQSEVTLTTQCGFSFLTALSLIKRKTYSVKLSALFLAPPGAQEVAMSVRPSVHQFYD